MGSPCGVTVRERPESPHGGCCLTQVGSDKAELEEHEVRRYGPGTRWRSRMFPDVDVAGVAEHMNNLQLYSFPLAWGETIHFSKLGMG